MNNRALLLAFILALLAIPVNMYSQKLDDASILENRLPSEQALESIKEPSPASVRPGVRARPGDIGQNEKPQKVPIGNISFATIISILAASSLYGYSKRINFAKTR